MFFFLKWKKNSRKKNDIMKFTCCNSKNVDCINEDQKIDPPIEMPLGFIHIIKLKEK